MMDGKWNRWWMWALAPFILLIVGLLWMYDWIKPKPKANAPKHGDKPWP